MTARVTDPAVLTGPAHFNSFKVHSVELPGGMTTPDAITLAGTPHTTVTVQGKPAHITHAGEQSRDQDQRTEFGTYEVKIPLK